MQVRSRGYDERIKEKSLLLSSFMIRYLMKDLADFNYVFGPICKELLMVCNYVLFCLQSLEKLCLEYKS